MGEAASTNKFSCSFRTAAYIAGSAGIVAGRGVVEDPNDGAVDKQLVPARTRIA